MTTVAEMYSLEWGEEGEALEVASSFVCLGGGEGAGVL